MIIYCDIDGVLLTNEKDYNEAKPIYRNINILNKLYDRNTIILWTARGTTTGISWRKLTSYQLKKYGVKYHKLKMKKPYYDILIDDRATNSLDDINDPDNIS